MSERPHRSPHRERLRSLLIGLRTATAERNDAQRRIDTLTRALDKHQPDWRDIVAEANRQASTSQRPRT